LSDVALYAYGFVGSCRGGVSMGLSSGCCRRRRRGDARSGVGAAVAEHGVDDVGAASGQADQGGVVSLALK
jgi:hypothetical protein